VSAHYFETLRILIIDVEMFLDLINVIEKTFEILFLQKELFVSFQFPLKFFVISARGQKRTHCII